MRTLNLEQYLADVEERKAALGIDNSPEAIDALRNKGARRTASKRELLRRTEERARAANLPVLPSYY